MTQENRDLMGGKVEFIDGKYVLIGCKACFSIQPCTLRSKSGRCSVILEEVNINHQPLYCGVDKPKKVVLPN